MNMRTNARAGGGSFPLRRGLSLLSLGLLLPAAGCSLDRLLDVEDPDKALPGTLQDVTALPVVHAGALADFQAGFIGIGATGGGSTGEGQVLISGMLSDEFYSADSFNTRQEVSRAGINTSGPRSTSTNANLTFAERWLHRARRSTENAAEAFEAADRAADQRRNELLALAGYTYVMFGENYCAGVPFSSVPRLGGPPEFGAPNQTSDIFNIGVARFDAAIGNSPIDSIRHLANIGKARALLNQGNFAGAAALVAAVPTGYRYRIFHSDNTARQENAVFHYGQNSGRYGVPNRLGGTGLPWLEIEAAGDPRIMTTNRNAFSAELGTIRVQTKYARTTGVVLASGIEARLIQAEAALAKGASADYLTFLNALRADSVLLRAHTGVATASALPALTDPGTPAGRVDQFFQERAVWLWLTSHRLGDMRRLVRQYDRPAATVFPQGEHGFYMPNPDPETNETEPFIFVPATGGGQFGGDLNLPLYVDEANNPQFNGCLTRAA